MRWEVCVLRRAVAACVLLKQVWAVPEEVNLSVQVSKVRLAVGLCRCPILRWFPQGMGSQELL
jgi:hypothetical protein